MHRPGSGQGMPRRTGDWKKQSFAPTGAKTPSSGGESGTGNVAGQTPAGSALTGREIAAQMQTVPNWSQHGLEIRRKFNFADFSASIHFVNQIAKLAEADQHHPDILVQWNKVTLTLTTHSEKGLTSKDFDLAKKIDSLS